MKTFSQKPADVTRKWYLLDASQTSVGRVATVAASLLLGKGKPTITAHVDGGDFVVIINADQVMLTGNKTNDKRYHYHSGFPGGLRTQTVNDVGRVAAIEEAVRGMLPRNKLIEGRLARLKVYPTTEHTHAPQQLVTYDLKKGSK